MFSTGFTTVTVLRLFPYQVSSLFLCRVSYSISSNIGEVLSINPSANVFVFVDFNVHHEDWLTHFARTDRLVNFVMTSNDLTQMVNFPTWIPDSDSHSPSLLD